MQLVRQVQFKRSQLLDEITLLSKNLFNVTTYTVRQRLFEDRHWIRYNELWNLLKSHNSYQSLSKRCNNTDVTRRILKLHRKWNNKVKDFFHKTSRTVVNYCISHDIGTIIIGYNEGWKQNVNIGKKNNQSFVSIPFLQLVHQIEYKSEMVGIKVVRNTEEYTSQACSSCGIIRKSNRKHRGLYACKDCGTVLNADVNASRNMIITPIIAKLLKNKTRN